MKEDKSKVNCPIFREQESVIKDITAKINEAKGVQEKAKFAMELLEEVDVLLSCPDYDDEKRPGCENCYFIASLRKQTADLIIKAKKLTKKRG